jgi:hypothetical protein
MISNEMKKARVKTSVDSARKDEDGLNLKAMVRSDMRSGNPYENY